MLWTFISILYALVGFLLFRKEIIMGWKDYQAGEQYAHHPDPSLLSEVCGTILVLLCWPAFWIVFVLDGEK